MDDKAKPKRKYRKWGKKGAPKGSETITQLVFDDLKTDLKKGYDVSAVAKRSGYTTTTIYALGDCPTFEEWSNRSPRRKIKELQKQVNDLQDSVRLKDVIINNKLAIISSLDKRIKELQILLNQVPPTL